jgi:voltage-gated potassium channel
VGGEVRDAKTDKRKPTNRRRRRTDSTDERWVERVRRLLGEPMRQLQISLLVMVLLTVVGTLGFMIIEHGSALDSLYMTVITLTTTGFEEVFKLDRKGKMFTMMLLVIGVISAAWAITNAIEVVLGQTFWVGVQRRRMGELLMDLRDHYIVCGYGRLGKQIVRDLQARGERFLIVEWAEEMEEYFLEKRIPHVIGDATHDETLEKAGVRRARGLVSALDKDANNVLTVLTAREMNPGLLIVSRANSELIEPKLARAGADRTVTPEAIGGHRLSLALLRPAVHDLFSRIFNPGETPDVDVGQITIAEDSPYAGQTVAGCDLRRLRNLTVLAIRQPGGEFDLTPPADRVVQVGDTIVVIGPAQEVYEVESQNTQRPDVRL